MMNPVLVALVVGMIGGSVAGVGVFAAASTMSGGAMMGGGMMMGSGSMDGMMDMHEDMDRMHDECMEAMESMHGNKTTSNATAN